MFSIKSRSGPVVLACLQFGYATPMLRCSIRNLGEGWEGYYHLAGRYKTVSGEEKSDTELCQRMAVLGLSLSAGVICIQDLTLNSAVAGIQAT